MQQQALLLSGLIALGGGCVIKVPAVLDAGDDGDDDTGGQDELSSEDDSADTDDADTDEGDTDEPDLPEPGPLDGDGCSAALDILLVIDNSGSMGEFQRTITDAFPQLIDGLDLAGVDWRLAVTTTDSGNLWCQAETTTPEYGSFVSSSCTTRLDDFLFGDVVDVQDLACNDICELDPEQLDRLPTSTAADMNAKPRPWLQREAGQLNLAAGVDVGDALRCMLPQGINGCGFEQPLESMRRALARTTTPELPENGFLRDHASLLVLLVTDEVDCSVRAEHEQAVFGPDGNKVFWSDPQANFPNSAACWNAGVECVGDPSDYDDCVAANKDVLGQSSSPEDAVLHPITRYQNLLSEIEQSKRALDPGLDVALFAVTGVELDGTITYGEADGELAEFQANFGIGPGCMIDPFSGAVPPVRIREVAGHMTSDPLYSICAEDFGGLMLDALERFVGGC